jgi:5-formyltetrahydrofolate cyclo-ligase
MKIGLAYAVTQVENFLSDPHDINMDVILTEYSEI